MNIDTAKLFCDLVELKNFSRAAELHGISQSAVSQQIAQIEMEHKTQLFNRKKRPIELTDAGQIFYKGFKDIVDRYNQLTNEITALSQSNCRLQLAAIFSIGMHTLQSYVKKFMSIYPDVNLSIEYEDAKGIYDRLLRGAVDIGIVALPRQDRNIKVYAFENEPLVLACSPSHSFSHHKEIDIHMLQGEPFISFVKDVPTRHLIDEILGRYQITVRMVMEFDNIETIKRAVEINSGLSILPAPSLQTEIKNGSLRAVEFTNDHFMRPTGIIIRKDKIMPKAGQYLIELLRREYSQEV